MATAKDSGTSLRRSVVCPNCWREFPPTQVRFIAESVQLRGDPIAGPTEQLRFRAMRFDASGNAIDPNDGRCTRIACPRCHIEFPRALLELRQIPISVVGAPGSGKTNLLASGMWGLAQRAADFGLEIVDADPRFNALLHRNESLLFATRDPSADVTLPKTDVGGNDLYRSVRIGGQTETLTKPSYFVTRHKDETRRSVMVLYDNAGEHFLPDSQFAGAEIATRHLERSSAIVTVFDPLQDARFRDRFADGFDAPHTGRHERQELVLTEAIARVRRLRSLDPTAPIPIPLIIALTKADVWADKALGADWSELDLPDALIPRRKRLIAKLQEVDQLAREALRETAPEFLNAANILAQKVIFVPASALGTSPTRDADGHFKLRAADVRPRWAEMPFVLAIAMSDPKVFPMLA